MERTGYTEYSLLRQFEPAICYTRGERFYPVNVEQYLQKCSLWVQRPRQPASMLVPEGELTVEKLTEPRQDGSNVVYFVKFIEPLDLLDLARYSLNEAVKSLKHSDEVNLFHAGQGRLSRVGYASRFVDALFSITLFMRGRVPGDTAAAAALTYRKMRAEQNEYPYYGRVIKENDWIILQYWYFYPFNNWRTGFFGGNDHEGDWEMACIYCSEETVDADDQRKIVPRWVAFASHDFSGDDLRRHWNDPEVEKIGDHPLIYAGAGSHASYFTPGEYLAELEIPYLSPLVRAVSRAQNFWAGTLRQGPGWKGDPGFNVFRIPFVDYARGDGFRIGPGQASQWNACLLSPTPEWVSKYRGLWGLYAQDPVAGENAPAGPMYNRDGSVRLSWYDPLGWAGLDKVPPPERELEHLQKQRAHAARRRTELEIEIDQKSSQLAGLGVEAVAIRGFSHLGEVYQEQACKITEVSKELTELRRQLTIEDAKIEAFELQESRLKKGEQGNLRGHLRRAHRPSSEVHFRLGIWAEVFSAISVGLLLIGIVLMVAFARHYLLFGLAAMIGIIVFVESSFRRQLTRLVTSLSIGLAIVSALILLFHYFWPVVVSLVLLISLYIIWDNFRELRS